MPFCINSSHKIENTAFLWLIWPKFFPLPMNSLRRAVPEQTNLIHHPFWWQDTESKNKFSLCNKKKRKRNTADIFSNIPAVFVTSYTFEQKCCFFLSNTFSIYLKSFWLFFFTFHSAVSQLNILHKKGYSDFQSSKFDGILMILSIKYFVKSQRQNERRILILNWF